MEPGRNEFIPDSHGSAVVAARRFGVSPNFVRRLVKAGLVRTVQRPTCARPLIVIDDVGRVLRESVVEPAQPRRAAECVPA